MNYGVEFKSITKRYGLDANAPLVIKGVSFEIEQGSLTTILGPSGCGKTTVLRMIAGLETPSGGQILMQGKDVTTLGPADRNVSMMFQSYALFPHMNVIENVMYGLKMSGVEKVEALRRAADTLGNVGLVGYNERLPSELSGGQQQRVALARALVLEPGVLLFDEPLSNLDARLRREMREEIRSLQQRLHLTVAYVTHDQSEALAVSDQIIVMNEGLIAQRGTPQDMYERPGSEFVAGFMGEAMLFSGVAADDGSVQLGPLSILPRQRVSAGAVKVAVRPEAWHIHRAVQGLPASLRKRAYLGSFFEYTFDTVLGPVFVVSPDLTLVLELGAQVGLSLADHGVSVVQVGAA
ncbi:MAG: ABC transporter ATP-binding protein [Rhodoferax sp.]|nr:ABC transporter ATP-binding protein [Rhodoferax sp.]MCF8208363.1 ABC transporter ATP-binding protein [Rhodoferax sp.]